MNIDQLSGETGSSSDFKVTEDTFKEKEYAVDYIKPQSLLYPRQN
jgi:hypothetical protein